MSASARPIPWSRLAGCALRPWTAYAAAACLAVAATLGIALIDSLRMAYEAPSLHVAVETGTALILTVATAIVIRGRREAPRLDRMLIAAGLAVIAVTSAALAAMSAIEPGAGPRGVVGLSGMLVGTLVVGVGAIAPARPVQAPRRAVATTAVVVVLAALGAAVGPVEYVLDEWRRHEPGPDPMQLLLTQPVRAIALQFVMAVSLVVASLGLTLRGTRSQDAFARHLGLAVLFFAFSMIQYALLPPVGQAWVHIGDLLRLLFCIVLLWAAVREVASAVAARAAARERRRIARDLHDGVAQELAFIRRRAARLAGDPDAQQIVVAAERALEDSRWAIERLARTPDEPLERVLARHAAVIAARTGVAVRFSTTGSAEVGPEVSEALERILGEAVANARHGGATVVHVELTAEPLRLRVVDDGSGFDTTASTTGFGLGGMRERAELVGAELSVRSGPGAGTEVAVELR